MRLKVEGRSHVGMKRNLNEDSYLINPETGLYIIADGMGGHKAGEVASRMAVETIEDYWKKYSGKEEPSFLEPIEKKDVSERAKHLINSIYLANIIIHEAQKKVEYHRMGSTVSVILDDKDCLWVANVGDSPVYIFDNGHLILVSEEHSVEAEQKSMGLSDSLDSTNPMIKNMLTRVLGLNEKVDVYITPIRPEAGDIILMCSDGLVNYLPEKPIRAILKNQEMSLEEKTGTLVDEANRGGGGDNISVILLEVLEEGRWHRIKKRFTSK